ncbi:Crp/Fnr family transcriptional regulator [Salmonella enterica subsp. enterica serovar Choleraesuis]|nr:Crp/Fnr family transcriptional regulator [Salmonella enterica subsp. enterica serovar Choleraesuis]
MKDKSYDMIDKSRECLAVLGVVTHRAMFGGYSLAIGNVVFAMVAQGSLYLRACEANADYFSACNSPMLSFYKRGRKVTLNYYLVDGRLWEDIPELCRMAWRALDNAQRFKAQRNAIIRLKDLPNLTMKMEVQLYRAGINDIQTLKAYGSRICWLRMKAYNNSLGVRSLYALEGAIEGIHADALPTQTRRELLTWVTALPRSQQH